MTSLLSTADRLRTEGRLHEATEAYSKLLEAEPTNKMAARFANSVNLMPPATRMAHQEGYELAPFVLKTDFLPPEIYDRFLAAFENARDSFTRGDTTRGTNLQIRRTHVIGNAESVLGVPDVEKFYECLSRFWRTTTHYFTGIDLKVESLETQATLYLEGGFYRPHRDIGPNNTRRMTFVYYLFSEPKIFSGGDLLLYDTNIVASVEPHGIRNKASKPLIGEKYTRILPQANSLVIFPSEFFHEVTSLESLAKSQGERFSITGWLHTSSDEASIEFIRNIRY